MKEFSVKLTSKNIKEIIGAFDVADGETCSYGSSKEDFLKKCRIAGVEFREDCTGVFVKNKRK